jgi:hypothetical protein
VTPKPSIEPNAIYSREETAHVLGISLTTLKQLIRAGHLVISQPVGIRRVFIKGASILEMLDRTTLQPGSDRRRSFGNAALVNQPATIWQNNYQNNLALRAEKRTTARRTASVSTNHKSRRVRGGASR